MKVNPCKSKDLIQHPVLESYQEANDLERLSAGKQTEDLFQGDNGNGLIAAFFFFIPSFAGSSGFSDSTFGSR